MKQTCVFLVGLMCLAAGVQSAHAAKPDDIETDYPLTIEDASPTDAGDFDLRLMSRYEHTADHNERVELEPEFEYGLGFDTELNVTLPFDLGSADDDHGGDLGIEVLHSFVDEGATLPELSASAKIVVPSGEKSAGLDTTLRVLATKHVLEAYGQHALHVNVSWSHNAAAAPDARDNAYQIVVGSSHGLNNKTFLVTDLVREQETDSHDTENLAEIGFRHELAPDLMASLGSGVGLGPDSPDVRVTFGIQKTF